MEDKELDLKLLRDRVSGWEKDSPCLLAFVHAPLIKSILKVDTPKNMWIFPVVNTVRKMEDLIKCGFMLRAS